jgi:antitoxin HigA-1
MIPKNRPPATPGEILLEEFIKPLGMTQSALAEKMGVPVQTINVIVNNRRSITPEMAVKLARTLNTSPQLWMNLQTNYDLWHAQRAAG